MSVIKIPVVHLCHFLKDEFISVPILLKYFPISRKGELISVPISDLITMLLILATGLLSLSTAATANGQSAHNDILDICDV